MTLKEKKRKLSEILGVNLFEPRYKEIDGVLGADEDTEAEKAAVNDSESAEEAKTDEAHADDAETEKTDNSEEEKETEADEKADVDGDADESGDVTEDEDSQSDNESESADGAEPESNGEAKKTEDTETAEDGGNGLEEELFDARLEAKMLRAGVREDKLDAAIKLFKADHGLADINKVEEWIKEYPEWTKQKTIEQAKSFGMEVGDNDSGETAEEKRLRELGII